MYKSVGVIMYIYGRVNFLHLILWALTITCVTFIAEDRALVKWCLYNCLWRDFNSTLKSTHSTAVYWEEKNNVDRLDEKLWAKETKKCFPDLNFEPVDPPPPDQSPGRRRSIGLTNHEDGASRREDQNEGEGWRIKIKTSTAVRKVAEIPSFF